MLEENQNLTKFIQVFGTKKDQSNLGQDQKNLNSQHQT